MTPYETNEQEKEYNERRDDQQKQKQQHGSSKPRSRNDRHSEDSSMHPMFRSVSMVAPAAVSFSSPGTINGKNKEAPLKSNHLLRKTQSAPGAVDPHIDASSRVWNVEHLREVPVYYPLEKCAISLRPNTLATLTQQIAQFMKERSISCVYHDRDGRVDCMASSLVHFAVQLWKGSLSDEVIIEIQRRQGCCIEMQRLRQDLIRCLVDPDSGKMHIHRPPTEASIQLVQKLIEQSTRSDGTNPLPSLTMEDCRNACSICFRLLGSNRLDEKRLGLESLCFLTDARKVLTQQACLVSTKILTDPQLHTLLVGYFTNAHVKQGSRVDRDIYEDDRNETMDYARGAFFGEMHILALKALSNALDTVLYFRKYSGESGLATPTMDLSVPFWNHALQAMVYNIHVSATRPLEACFSVHCLRRLHKLIPQNLSTHPAISQDRSNLEHWLADARSFGQKRYFQLEHETNEFLTQLGLAY
ncbi:MAG: hypothetical protein SGILL_001202 [Bacillariaceae sp.]